MPPKANKPPPSQPAGRPKNARPTVVPVIPLPLVQKQQLQRQQKQQQLELEKKQQEEKERKEREKKEKEELDKKEKELKAEKQQQEKEKKAEEAVKAEKKLSKSVAKKDKNAPAGDSDRTSAEVSAPAPTPADNASSLSSTTTPQTAHETTTSVSSPVAKTPPQSTSNTPSADPTAAPFVPPSAIDGHAPALGGQLQPHIPTGPSSAGVPPNGHSGYGVPEFVFPPHSRSGSAARHRGPPRHAVNPQLPQHPLHNQHHPHPGFHQPHPSASSITFGTFHDSNSASPVPTGHGPLPPPPGLMGGAPQFISYNVPSMGGPGEWQQQGHPGVLHVGDANVNGFAPSSAGFNPSTPGSFHGSHSPDNAADGTGFQHQGGPYPVPSGPNGHLPLRNSDSMSSMMSPPFFPPPSGFPNSGPHDRHGGGRNGVPTRGIDFQFVHHLQHHIQRSFDNPQTTDCHLVLHLPSSESNTLEQQPVSTTMFAGHRSVLAQSYSVGNLLRSDSGIMHNGPFNQPILALHMKIEDPYITIEAAIQALRSLYGHPLADPTTDRSMTPVKANQALDKALANVAAGFIFMLDHVESVAADQAERLLGWDTVEKVLAFCLNGATFPNTAGTEKTAYGPAFGPAWLRYARGAGTAVRRLLSRAIAFVAHNVPADFVFNASAPSSAAQPLATLLRFPIDTWSAIDTVDVNVNTSTDSSNSATHARSAGSVSLPVRKTSDSISAKQGGGVRSPKILFGDFATDEAAKTTQSINGVVKGVAASGQADHTNADDISTVLSRILLNLPFCFLEHILVQPQLAAHRESFARAIVDERERRRLQALDGLHASAILNEPEQRDAVVGRNQQPTPPTQSNPPFSIEEWDVLGWKEVLDGETGRFERVWAHADASR
ncbi:hypothetical protein SCUCBS95973_005698 [Sporothrix curviconia]|uniref:BTB domain-containing protein n=1 Tax=Sporothrix curviconia TaxID=1260050 RepID=A0ABP0BYZ8_9PEZI